MADNIKQKIKSLIDNAKKIALICHIRPDGDTIGSTLALCNYLRINNKTCDVFCDDILPDKYNFLKGYDGIKNSEIGEDYDLLICLDCSDTKRTGKYSNFIVRHKNTINIDHHISNEKFATLNYVTEISSTCELIFQILKSYDALPDKDTYMCIYCGLSSDTGNFSHSNTTYTTFETAAELSKVIGDISIINRKIFKEKPINMVRLLNQVLSSLEMYADDKIAILTVYLKDLAKYNCLPHDTEGFVDYAINISGVEVGAILMQSENNSYKISLRSKQADVCKIASEFGGGGHKFASGCMLYGERDEVVKKLVKNAEFYL